jgi:hypothetical protein
MLGEMMILAEKMTLVEMVLQVDMIILVETVSRGMLMKSRWPETGEYSGQPSFRRCSRISL